MAFTLDNGEYLDLGNLPLYLYGGHKVFAPGEYHIERCHSLDVLIVMESGTLHFSEDKIPVELHAGEYYIQYSNRRQKAQFPSDAVYYYFEFYGKRVQKGKQTLHPRGIYSQEEILPLCREILTPEQNAEGFNTGKAALFHELLSRLYCRQIAVVSTKRRAIELREYLDAHFTEPITTAEVAKHFGFCKDHLSRFFRRQYGISPRQYISQRRIALAKMLLAEGDQSMGEIALSCGFCDYSTFYRSFLRTTGMVPGQWLRLNKGEK